MDNNNIITDNNPGAGNRRLLALDVLRGITVAGMILVNNPGDWGYIYAPLRHAEWNGMTPTDLVFPFFMFVMGVSMSFSFSKFSGTYPPAFWRKLFRRTGLLFLLGVFLSWFSLVLGNLVHGEGLTWVQTWLPWHDVRILGVLQRLALTYCLASVLVALVRSKAVLMGVAAGTLVVYALILALGHGFELSQSNVIAVVDRTLWGESHMYREWLPDGGRISFDPEGLLSTLPGVAHVLAGYFCGEVVRRKAPLDQRLLQLTVAGICLLFAGLLLSYGCPLNKKVWSPTFVLVTCGFAYLLLVLLIWVIDVRRRQRWCFPFQTFGMNPLFIYVFASLLAVVVEVLPAGGGMGLQERVYGLLAQVFRVPELASLVYALLFVSLNGAVAWLLYRRKIFIKL